MSDGPRMMLWDIETTPNIGDRWSLFSKSPMSINQLRQPSYVFCFGAKWYGDKKVEFRSEFHDSREEMVRRAFEYLDEADVVVDYNGIKFDQRKMNWEFELHGLGRPSPYQRIDLLRVVRRNFDPPSMKLEFVASSLGIGHKVKHEGHDLWVQCMDGDPKAWARMKRYNIQDVNLLEPLYNRLRAWVPSHPNMRLFGDASCPNCPAEGTLVKQGFKYTLNGKFQRYRCSACGGWSQGSKRLDGTEIRSMS